MNTADPRSWAWQRLRLLRSDPPGLAGNSTARARVMSAALDQAEQLSRAAETIGPAAQPLPLFYALSQAGRAITAVRLRDDWQLSAHGLKWPGDPGSNNLLERRVEPQDSKTGSFQRVAEAVGSATLSAPVELGAVWLALPELALPRLPTSKPTWRPALNIASLEPDSQFMMIIGKKVEGLVAGLPDVSSRQAIMDELKHYPSARDGVPKSIPHDTEEKLVGQLVGQGHWAPRVVWEAPDSTAPARKQTFNRVAPPYLSRSVHSAIPEMPTGNWLSPLMLWWVLLFGLSNLARYEPGAWTAALDVNTSQFAVPLETGMREALDSVPHLVLEALLGRFVERHDY
jgi:YaaC-like Protein